MNRSGSYCDSSNLFNPINKPTLIAGVKMKKSTYSVGEPIDATIGFSPEQCVFNYEIRIKDTKQVVFTNGWYYEPSRGNSYNFPDLMYGGQPSSLPVGSYEVRAFPNTASNPSIPATAARCHNEVTSSFQIIVGAKKL